MLHIRHIAATFFAKAYQRLALLQYMAHRKPRPLSVAPRLPVDRQQNGLGLDLADVPQVVFQNALLGGNLCTCIHMLHGTPSAHAEMGAFRLDAHESWLNNLAELRYLKAGFFTI